MKTNHALSLFIAIALVTGCAKSTRSLSNSGYRDSGGRTYYAPRPNNSDPGFEYRGELSEFDVLGITRTETASEADIEKALAAAKQIRLKSGASILLVQSGAIFPDAPMVNELSQHFRVVPFTGVPPVSRRGTDGQFERYDAGEFSKSLRLAAARGGCETILCYWGILESESAKLATKTISWVPVAGWFIPDENQHMRLRLKLALAFLKRPFVDVDVIVNDHGDSPIQRRSLRHRFTSNRRAHSEGDIARLELTLTPIK